MSAPELLARLAAVGAAVRAVEDRLRIEAPAGALTPELRAALAEQKPALLALLREPPQTRAHLCAGCGKFYFPEPARLCYWCRQRQARTPLGPPCDGCGEACERCLGDPNGHSGSRHSGPTP